MELSVPDVFSMRAGANFTVDNWGFSAGLRNEGSPVEDLFGASNGARRAGHNLSFEPGVVYKFKKATLYMYIPIAMVHEIKQNLPDKKITEITGAYFVGAGGSADYQVFLGVQFKL